MAVATALLLVASGVLLLRGQPLAAVLAVYAAGVCTGVPPMIRTFRQWVRELAAWSDALVTARVADHAHTLAHGVRRWVGDAADLVEPHDPVVSRRLRDDVATLRARATSTLELWREQASPERAQGFDEGYMAGLAVTSEPRSPAPMRRFATYQGTPRWLPRPVRRVVVRALRGVDVVRLLHTPEIERKTLIVSLWLRMAFVVVAPLIASATFTGVVPLDDRGATAGIWAIAVAFAAVTAVTAGRVADYAIGRPTRWRLYAAEQTLTVLVIVSSPCWPIAVFGAGAVNWLERPDWTLRRLLVWMGITYGALAVGGALAGASTGDVVAEIAVGIAVTAVMAGSYGLMLPATVATFVGVFVGALAWQARAFVRVRRDRQAAESVIGTARDAVVRLAADDPRVDRVLHGLEVTRAQLDDPRQVLERRPRTLAALCSRALTAIVAPEGSDLPADRAMRCTPIDARPTAVGDLRLRSARLARALERLLKRLALEAVENGGRDVLFCRLEVDRLQRIVVTVGNGVSADPEAQPGFGTGATWIARRRSRIPDCQLVRREVVSGAELDLEIDVFVVQFTVGTAAFQPTERTFG